MSREYHTINDVSLVPWEASRQPTNKRMLPGMWAGEYDMGSTYHLIGVTDSWGNIYTACGAPFDGRSSHMHAWRDPSDVNERQTVCPDCEKIWLTDKQYRKVREWNRRLSVGKVA